MTERNKCKTTHVTISAMNLIEIGYNMQFHGKREKNQGENATITKTEQQKQYQHQQWQTNHMNNFH